MLSHTKYGTGPLVWLAFHGIGQDAACFAPLGEVLARTHTIYSIDLPFHGQNPLANGPLIITRTYWQRLITDFLAQHGIDRFSVAGFSIGGRFALVTAELFANQIEAVILLAPDGITDDPWFRLGTSTGVGRAGLRVFLNNTRLFLGLGRGLVRLGLLNPALLRFVEATMQTPTQRTRIYFSWTGFRTIRVHLPTLTQILMQHGVRVRLFLGEFDAVLPRAHTYPLERALPGCEVTVLPTGHTSLVRRVAAALAGDN